MIYDYIYDTFVVLNRRIDETIFRKRYETVIIIYYNSVIEFDTTNEYYLFYYRSYLQSDYKKIHSILQKLLK